MMSALSFLTIFGRGTPMRPTAYRWFPVVGLAIGCALAAVWWGGGELWHPFLAAVLTVAADAVLTGALHYDGLADSADGLLPHLEPHRRLDVMRSPEIGAFAVVTIGLVFLGRVGAVAATPIEWWMFPVVAATSRTIVAATPAIVPPARPDSIGATFAAGSSERLLLWLGPLTGIATMLGAGRGVLMVAAVVAGSGIVVIIARRRLGGWTGDVLGAAIVVGETLGFLAAAAQP